MSMLMTVTEVSKELRVNRNYVYSLINSGLLKTIKIGHAKVRRETLEKFLEEYDGCDISEVIKKKGKSPAEAEPTTNNTFLL